MRYLVGIGNYSMTDDSIGLRVVEHISEKGLARGFEVIDIADEGLRLTYYFTPETEKIVVIDAAELGLSPGEIKVFRPEEARSEKSLSGITTHEGDVMKVIAFARELGMPIPPIEIMGIQPASMEQGMDLSPVLRDRLDDYVKTAISLVGSGLEL